MLHYCPWSSAIFPPIGLSLARRNPPVCPGKTHSGVVRPRPGRRNSVRVGYALATETGGSLMVQCQGNMVGEGEFPSPAPPISGG